jgi:hypothetical protein
MPNDLAFYFAWESDPTPPFDAVVMAREDELIFNFELKHDEGQFCELTIEVANPYVGLLAPGRPLWAWFSYNDGSGVQPLFHGRLVGIPDDLFGQTIKLKLVARPPDYLTQQANLAASLRVLPYFDPAFVDDTKITDPNSVLEGYSALWHVDRLTGEVTISDILAGEDGIVAFTQSDVFYDSVQLKLASSPLQMVEIEATVDWTQCAVNSADTTTVPGLTGNPDVGNGVTVTSGVSAPSETPAASEPPQTTYSWSYKNSDSDHADGDLISNAGSITVPFYYGYLTSRSISLTPENPDSGQGGEFSISESYKDEIAVDGSNEENSKPKKNARATVQAEVSQDRKEAVYVAVTADVQPVLLAMTENEKDTTQSMTLNSRDLAAAGIIDTHANTYLPTARGLQSIEYLLMVARAHLLQGSRVVQINWECPFRMATGLSCRMNATIEDARIPGNLVMGKIVSYSMTGDGDSGAFLGAVQIDCAVGNGDAVVAGSDGVPTYVDEDYVDKGYQFYDGEMITSSSGDISFEPIPYEAAGLQLPLSIDQLLLDHTYNSVTPEGQQDLNNLLTTGAMQLANWRFEPVDQPLTSPPPSAITFSQAAKALDDAVIRMRNQQSNQAWVEMHFAPVQGLSTSLKWAPRIGMLGVPKQIDLGAASGRR